MQFELRGSNILVSHGKNEGLLFNSGGREKRDFKNIYDVINEYIASLGKERGNKLYEIYVKMRDFFKHVYELEDVNAYCSDILKQLFQLIDIDRLRNYCRRGAKFYYPSDLSDTLGRYSADTTYLIEDYRGLLFLSTCLKIATPILGEIIYRYGTIVGNDHKASYAFNIILSSGVINDAPEFLKLKRLVEVKCSGVSGSTNSILAGISSSSLGEWSLASIVIQKVALGHTTLPGTSLIKKIHGYLTHTIKVDSLENRGGSTRYYTRSLEQSVNGKSTDELNSVSESYRIKQEYSCSYPLIVELYASNMENVMATLLPGEKGYHVPTDVEIKAYHDIDIYDWHIQLCAVALWKHISPTVLFNIHYDPLMRLMACVQSAMTFRGHVSLAHLLTAISVKVEDNAVLDISLTAITEKLSMELIDLYKMSGEDIGTATIEAMVSDIMQLRFYINSPEYIPSVTIDSYFKIPVELRSNLAVYLIDFLAPVKLEKAV